MSFKEKSTWIMAMVVVGAYALYIRTILGRAESIPIADVPYVSTLIWTIGAIIVAAIVAHIVVAIASPGDVDKEDHRRGFQQW